MCVCELASQDIHQQLLTKAVPTSHGYSSPAMFLVVLEQ